MRVALLGAPEPGPGLVAFGRIHLGADWMVTDYLAAYDDLTGRPER